MSEYNKSTPSAYGRAEYALTPEINLAAGLRDTEESDTLGNSSYVGGTTLTGNATCDVPPPCRQLHCHNIAGANA